MKLVGKEDRALSKKGQKIIIPFHQGYRFKLPKLHWSARSNHFNVYLQVQMKLCTFVCTFSQHGKSGCSFVEMEKSSAPQNNDALQALDMSQHNSFQHPQRGLNAISVWKKTQTELRYCISTVFLVKYGRSLNKGYFHSTA